MKIFEKKILVTGAASCHKVCKMKIKEKYMILFISRTVKEKDNSVASPISINFRFFLLHTNVSFLHNLLDVYRIKYRPTNCKDGEN